MNFDEHLVPWVAPDLAILRKEFALGLAFRRYEQVRQSASPIEDVRDSKKSWVSDHRRLRFPKLHRPRLASRANPEDT